MDEGEKTGTDRKLTNPSGGTLRQSRHSAASRTPGLRRRLAIARAGF